MANNPFFSVITVCFNDAWSLQKTVRSVFEQSFTDFEYIVVDGGSNDGTQSLIEFWQEYGLVTRSVSEPDRGVYDAMNKGLQMASGRFVCFMNANDVFASSDVLQRVHDFLAGRSLDGVLGWGKLNGRIWASWSEHEAVKMASLGLCHQALYVRRALLLDERFDDRPFKTNSDSLQLGRLYGKGARIPILPEVLAVRGGDPGISANLERTAISIRDTLSNEYPDLTEEDVETILNFRRRCSDPEGILRLMENGTVKMRASLSRMVLDTMFQHQSKALEPEAYDRFLDRALDLILSEENGAQEVKHLIFVQNQRAKILEGDEAERGALQQSITAFEKKQKRYRKGWKRKKLQRVAVQPKGLLRTRHAPIVTLTSFPARLPTVSFVIESLFEQTCPPQEVHLVLGLDEFANKNDLPKSLRRMEKSGLVIHFAEKTKRQYNKFLHNKEINASKPFVIVDDDVIYPPYSLEHLLDGHVRYPHAVVGNRCYKIFDRHGTPKPHREWKVEAASEPSFWLIPTGVGGVLYPPGFLTDPRVTKVADILACAPYADDIWLKVCALSRALPTFATELSNKTDWYVRYTPTMEFGALKTANVGRGLNDFQVIRCFQWLDRIWPKWRSSLLEQELVSDHPTLSQATL